MYILLTVIAGTTNHKHILPCAHWVDAVDYNNSLLVTVFARPYDQGERCLPACETDNPANSMSWSKDHPPISIRSLSSAAAFLEEIAWLLLVSTVYTTYGMAWHGIPSMTSWLFWYSVEK